MKGMGRRDVRSWRAALIVAGLAIAAYPTPAETQNTNMAGKDGQLTYTSGQIVVPIFGGWTQNPDGSFEMVFSYFNRNWQEELDVPVGPDNNLQPEPFGPDAGQP